MFKNTLQKPVFEKTKKMLKNTLQKPTFAKVSFFVDRRQTDDTNKIFGKKFLEGKVRKNVKNLRLLKKTKKVRGRRGRTLQYIL